MSMEQLEYEESVNAPEMEAGDDDNAEEHAEPIAVIAFTGRFPGASNTDDFWINLRDGVESVKFFTDDELKGANIDPAILKDPRYVRADAVLDDIDLFDAEFFNYSPREAEIMDPQHRLFMESAWEVMELAGYNIDTYDGRVGVFCGTGLSSYLIRNLLKNSEFVDSVGSFQTMLGNSQDFLATKISYKMNLMGPSVNVATLCSSSMVGVHLACESLWNYQTDMNLAGGVSIQISRNEAFFYQEGGIGAFDGHCRAFDARANGTVSGSGLGIVVLKRLSDAIADGDTIHAVIRGSAINNDGSVKLSYTAPSIDGQAEVIAEALSVGQINPASVTYLECHGTGTSLGDPVEVAGLTKAFRAFTDKKGYCAIGSVKTNIGHLVTAGGVASMIKTILALKHRQIPPSLNFEKPNPKIDFETSPFFVNTELRGWQVPDGTPLRAGVSSFGIGGTNAHLILEEAPESSQGESGRRLQLIPISARSEAALTSARARLAQYLERHPEINFEDAAYTMRVGRKVFNHRAILVAESAADAIAALIDSSSPQVLSQFQENRERPVAFLFSGQGSQYLGMAQGIYQSESRFREAVDTCAEILHHHLSLDIREVMWPETHDEAAAERLGRTAMTQPALFTLAYAQARLLMSWGIVPEAMLGHSIGEYVAAHLAGVFSLEDALAVVAERGRLIDSLPGGDMLAISKPEREVAALLDRSVSLAAVNGSASCVVSGDSESVARLRAKLDELGVAASLLHTSHAFHSKMMDPVLAAFTAMLAQRRLNAPEIPFVSNVTGTWITAEQAQDPEYWARHLRGTVRFHDGLGVLLEVDRFLVEVGPGRTLATFARQMAGGTKQIACHTIRHPREKVDDVQFLHTALGRLWLAGVAIDWEGYHEGQNRHRVPMPTYPFERRRYWIEPDMLGYKRENSSLSDESLLGVRKPDPKDWFYIPAWKGTPLPKAPKALQPRVRWLMFSKGDGLARPLSQRLVDEGQIVVSVGTGKQYNKLDHCLYQARPGCREDCDVLFADLAQEKLLPQIMVVFLDQNDLSPDIAFLQALHSVQALMDLDHQDPLTLIAVTEGLRDLDDGPASLSGAMVAGLLKVIPHECPQIDCRNVDVYLPRSGGWRERRLVSHLVAELTGDASEEQVAYRGDRRWVRYFEPLRPTFQEPECIRDGGTYLILGGLDGTGLEIADHLASKSRVNLVLTGRVPLPERREGGGAVEPSQQNAIDTIKKLEDAGNRVLTAQWNPFESASLETLMARIREAFGGLTGVVFAEGPAGRDLIGPLAEVSPHHTDFLSSLAQALPALARALEGEQLDFCVLLSSTAAEMGGMGLSVYAAANAFCDAFAIHHNRGDASPWTSFHWDGWLTSAERSAGMGEVHSRLAISRQEGLNAFELLLSNEMIDQVALATEDMPARLRRQRSDRRQPGSEREQKYTVHPRPNLSNPYVAPRNETERKIAEIWQHRLGIETVGIHDNYFDLGGDSLLVVKIRRALKDTFGGDLLTSDLFEHPTVASLAAHFAEKDNSVQLDEVKSRVARQKAAMVAEQEEMRGLRERHRSRGS